MRKIASLSVMIAGAVLVILFSYVLYGLLTSPPLLKWTIFTESIVFSGALVVLGLVLLMAGLFYFRKATAGLKSRTM